MSIKGYPFTPRIIGRIATGHSSVSQSGKRLPVKDDFFHLTTLVQESGTGKWVPHPLADKLAKTNKKLQSIPITIAYNDPDLNLRNSYTLFDNQTGRVVCSGDGNRARCKIDGKGIQDIDCPTPDLCPNGKFCKNYSRAYFRIDGQGDELGVFVLRTTSYNGLNSLYSTLLQLAGLTNGHIAGIPLNLVLSTKTTRMSFGQPIYYAELEVREGQTLLDAITAGYAYQTRMAEAHLSLDGMEEALRRGAQNSDFVCEEMPEDLYPEEELLAKAEKSAVGLKQLDSVMAKLSQPTEFPPPLNLPDLNPPGAQEDDQPPAASNTAEAAEPVAVVHHIPQFPRSPARRPPPIKPIQIIQQSR